MGFVYEVVPEEDREFFKSMGLKDCWGIKLLNLSKYTKWCADRERNIFLVNIGGGYRDMPRYYDLWWNGNVIRVEVEEGGRGSYDVGVDIVWNINRVPIPASMWKYKEDIMKSLQEAFLINLGWCEEEFLRTISVKMNCEPEKVEGR